MSKIYTDKRRPMTNADLLWNYNNYNNKYFTGAHNPIPKKIAEISFKNILFKNGHDGEFWVSPVKRKIRIHIRPSLSIAPCICLITLLHEMVHLRVHIKTGVLWSPQE